MLDPIAHDAPTPAPALDCAATPIAGPRWWEPAALLGVAVEFLAGVIAVVAFAALVAS